MTRAVLSSRLSLSRIVYGMWRLGDDSDTSARHVQAKIEMCLEHGISTMDQADIYGGYEAEALLGNCLKASPALRDRIEIVTKCGIIAPVGRYSDARLKHYDTSPAHITASIEQSLKNMRTNQIDLLLIHRPDPFMDHEKTGRALDDAIGSGKIRSVGVSNFRPHDIRLLQSAMHRQLVTNQIELSLIETAAFSNGDLAFMQESGMATMAWSPLGGGKLFGDEHHALLTKLSEMGERHGIEAGAMAIAWLLAHPAGIIPIIGTNKLDRISAMAKATGVKLDREDWFELYTAAIGREVA